MQFSVTANHQRILVAVIKTHFMAKILLVLVSIVLVGCNGRLHAQSAEEKIVRDFVQYVKSPHPEIDTVETRFLVPYPADTALGTRERRHKFLQLQLTGLKNHLEGVNIDSLEFLQYSEAPPEFKTLNPEDSHLDHAYILTDRKLFVRYFLVKGGLIQAFDFFQKGTWLLN